MPPKRKAASTKKSVVNASSEIPIDHDEFTNEETVEQSSSKQQQTQEQPETGSTSTNTAESLDQSEEEPATSGSSLKDKMAKLKELKRRRATEVEQGNRRDRNLEFQRSKENPSLDEKHKRKRDEALKLQEKQDALDNGEDYERKQFWKYSAESVETWEKKIAKKARLANNGFTDHTQAAHKKYERLMSDFKPDMSSYNDKKLQTIERAIRNGEDPSDISAMANSLDYATVDDKPSKEAIDRLSSETAKQIQKRETRSRDRKEVTDDISWINEKNRVFNQKIARFYDKYTKEIRENLERGTAL